MTDKKGKKFEYKENPYDKINYHATNVAAAGIGILGAVTAVGGKGQRIARAVTGAALAAGAYGLHHEAKQMRKDVENRERMNYELRRRQS